MYLDHTLRPTASAAILVGLVGLGLDMWSFSPSCGYIKKKIKKINQFYGFIWRISSCNIIDGILLENDTDLKI